MITHVPTPTDAAHRLVFLLEEKDQEDQAFADAIGELKKAHTKATERLNHEIHRVRQEILTGQTNFIDTMTEISHERPVNGE